MSDFPGFCAKCGCAPGQHPNSGCDIFDGREALTRRPSEIEQLAPALAELEQLRGQLYSETGREFELLVPDALLKGVARAWGVPVRHIPDLDCVYVAIRAELRDRPLFP